MGLRLGTSSLVDHQTHRLLVSSLRSMMELSSISSFLPHYAKGPIVQGFGRGSTQLGFPTANFPEDVIEKLPSQLIGGIYWGLAQVDCGPVHDMVMSVCFNPFYQNEKRAMETHIVHEFSEKDLYGRTLRVIMLGFLRPEKNYDSMPELIEAIRQDIADGKRLGAQDEFLRFRTDSFFEN